MKSLRKGIGNSKDVEIFYDKWSNSYDQTLYNWNYKAPKQSVNILFSSKNVMMANSVIQ